MQAEMFEKDAPNTVKNFCDLAKKGFYNGLISIGLFLTS